MFEDNFSFSDSIEIVPSMDEQQESNENEIQMSQDMEPILVNEVVEGSEVKKAEKKEDRKEDKRDSSRNNQRDNSQRSTSNRNQRNEDRIPSIRQQSLYTTTASLFVEKYNEYSGIPDFIVNQLFDINDGKGTITIEEAIIMFINLFPNAKDKINSARFIEDAIKIGKGEIINYLYKECKLGFSNIPLHSRDNLSKKITSDVENNNFTAALYDYQIMKLSGYIK